MNWWQRWRGGERLDRQLDAELRDHLERLTADHVAAGMPEAEARRRASIEFGGLEQIKDASRDARGFRLVEDLVQDTRYAVRVLANAPLFTLTAVLSLGVGIAGNATIFSLADALFFRAIPSISSPDRLVEVGASTRMQAFGNMTYPDYVDFRDRNTVFDDLAAYSLVVRPYGLGTGDSADRVDGMRVSSNYFEVLGVAMALGRAFIPEDDRPAAEPTVILTDRLWRTHFGANSEVVGQTIRLNGQQVRVVGVAPAGFSGHTIAAMHIWVPLTFEADTRLLTSRSAQWHLAVGRLKRGVSLDQARSQMARIAGDLERDNPVVNRGRGVALEGWRVVPAQVSRPAGAFLALLFALVGLILLIACVNVGAMLLARGATRAREVAVRLAIGAGRGRVVRMLVTESVLLAVTGSAFGVAVTLAIVRLLRRLIPILPVSIAVDFRLDWRVMLFSVAVSIAAGLVCGLLPAIESTRMDLADAVKPEGAHFGRRRARLRQTFVVAQVAMSVLLLVVAVLLGRSLLNADMIDPGFRTRDLEIASLDLRLAGYDERRGAVFVSDLVERVRGLPGVRSAAAAMVVPLTGNDIGLGSVRRPDQAFEPGRGLFPTWNAVTPEFLDTLGIPLVAGRRFTTADRASAPEVAIVNEALARRLWPEGDALGQRLIQDERGTGVERHIVGIVSNAKYTFLVEEPKPAVYLPFGQHYWEDFSLIVRTNGTPALGAVRTLIREMDASLPLVQAATFEQLTAFTLVPYRAAAWVAGGVGVIALSLAAIGLYGMTAFNATRRTREIGVRVALGAVRGEIVRLVVRQSMTLVGIGALIGLALAAAAAQMLTSLLLGIRPFDPASFAAGAALLAAFALTAGFIPAWRAALIDPVEALRSD